MFRKIEIWILYLVLILSLPVTIGFGVLVRQEIEGTTKKGSISIAFLSKPAAFIARFPETFFYKIIKGNPLRVYDPWDEKREFYDLNGFNGKPNSEESFLLLSRYDGDLAEGVVELIDLTNFKVLHTWNPDIDKFNNLVKKVDEFQYLDRDNNNSRTILMHPKLTKDNGLFFGWERPLVKIDSCSNLLFQKTDNEYHHSIESDIENNIWVSSFLFPQTLEVKKVGRNTYKNGGFRDDAIVKLTLDGKTLFSKSLAQIFIDNGLENLLFANGDNYENDPLHLNDIQPVNFDGDYWKKGDLFLSLRNLSMIVLYRPTTNKIIWKDRGPFLHQHDVDILDDHRIAVFNNRSINIVGDINMVDGNNEVNIYNFKTGKYSSYLKNSIIQNDVRTKTQGLSEILPNGDLFIEESNFGRTLYFNSDGSLRWTHVNSSNDGTVYMVGWSRILFDKDDIITVKNFLRTKPDCNV